MKQSEYEMWLCGIKGIGISKIKSLMEHFSSAKEIYMATEEELSKVKGIRKKEIHIIIEDRQKFSLNTNCPIPEDYGMKSVCYLSEHYPKCCKNLYSPPKQIYYIGKLPEEKYRISIVGARNCSHYGKEQARYFAYVLAKAGVGIISGMARGIDGWAHQGALESGGMTYAILGNSAEICYPKEHERLYQSIREHGGILSEYPPGTEARPGYFPMRNRLISAFSNGVLVVEAMRRSGSLITAGEAVEQGKDVFVIPGRIGDKLSEGCNELIKQGANLVTSPDDIADYYGIKREEKKENSEFSNFCLESEEKMVYASLRLEPKHVNTLERELKIGLPRLMKSIYALHKKGLILEVGNHYYIKNSVRSEKSN